MTSQLLSGLLQLVFVQIECNNKTPPVVPSCLFGSLYGGEPGVLHISADAE